MANQAVTGKYVPPGVSNQNLFVVEVVVPATLTAGDYIDITLPAGIPIQAPVAASDVVSWAPQSVSGWTAANPRLKTVAANLLLTHFDADTNVCRVTTAVADFVAGGTISLLVAANTLRTA